MEFLFLYFINLRMKFFALIFSFFLILPFSKKSMEELKKEYQETYFSDSTEADTIQKNKIEVSSKNQKPPISNLEEREKLISFAENYLGTPYLYAGTTPEEGFDCSGFIYYVFNRFGYEVPRSSKDFDFFG